MKAISHILQLFVLFTLLYVELSEEGTAQIAKQTVIAGKVLDANGEPLAGATIRIRETQIATIADIEGHFHIVYNAKDDKPIILNIYFIGMKTAEVRWKGQPLTIRMKEDTKVLNEVIVSTRPNINDIDLRTRSGVVSLVDMKEINQKPVVDISMALQGSVPGLVVVNQGELGTKPKIRLRGNNSFRHGDSANEPLYVLDGKIISSQAFITLNPLDIREIKVLKDAAASALYGVKAANGVIEITSRRGISGPLSISVSSNFGVTLRGRRPVEMMRTAEKLELERLVQGSSSPGYILSPDYYNTARMSDLQSLYHRQYGLPISDDRNAYAQWADTELAHLRQTDTDWFIDLLRNSTYQSHNLSLRGGNDAITYYVSGNYAMQGGQLPGNDTQRLSFSNSLDWQTRIGYISLSTTAGHSRTNTPNGTNYSPQTLVYELNPYETRESKSLYSFPGRSFAELMNQYRRQSSDLRVGSTLSFNLKPFPELRLDAVFGLDFVLSESEEITPANSPLETKRGKPATLRGSITSGKDTYLNYTSNIRATYHHTFGEHHDLTLSANTDYYYTRSKLLNVTGHGIGRLESLAGVNKTRGTSYSPDFTGTSSRIAQVGLGASVGYTYRNTYDLFGAYKLDASSLLPASKRWNIVWAMGAGLHIDQILKSLWQGFARQDILTGLHLKGSVGSTASLGGISASLALPIFSYDTSGYYGNHFRELKLTQMYNRELSPEQVNNFDLGVETQFFDRYTLSLQWYRKDTHNALLSISIPSSNGFDTMMKNVGQLRNQGYEISLSGQVMDTRDIQITARTSLAYNRSLVVDLYEAKAIYTNADAIFPEYEEGQPYDALFALQSLGINPLTGYPVFVDRNGNEKPFYSQVTREDFHSVGYSTPPYQGTISLNFTWRNFDLNAQLYYVFGGKKPYSMTYVRDKNNVHKNAIAGQLERTWFKPGDDGKLYPSPNSALSTFQTLSQYANTRMIAPSDYLRLSMLSMRYRIPEAWLQSIGDAIKYASVSMQTSNLFTLSPYKGSSPESGTFDIGVQPVYSLNLTMNF